jgi:hypothetical protein
MEVVVLAKIVMEFNKIKKNLQDLSRYFDWMSKRFCYNVNSSSFELRHSFSVSFQSQNSMNNNILFHISHPVPHRLSTVFRAL